MRASSMLYDHGELAESADLLNQALEYAEEDSDLSIDLVHLSGKLAAEAGRHDVAERGLRLAFDEEPSVIGHGRAFGDLLARQGRITEATAVINRALKHRPDDPSLLTAIDEYGRG